MANLPPVSAKPVANFSTIFASVVDTGGKFATGPPVSTMPAANCHRYQRHRRKICHRCRWHRWQITATISGCRQLKVNLKAKIYMYDNSTTQRCPNKIINIFLLEGFFHLPPVSLTPVANLELRISPRIFEKIRNGPNGIIRGLGETDSRKKTRSKNSRDTVPLTKCMVSGPVCRKVGPGFDSRPGTLYTATKISLMCSFLAIARPQPQFPHSCVCERLIESQDRSTYFLQENRQTDRGNI